MLKQFLPRTIEDVRASTTNIVDEGQKTIDGRSLRAISFDTLVKVMGISSSSHTTVYIDADGRIVRSEADAVAMRQKTRAVQEIRYDDSIRVTAPN
jgi:NADH dehydrogenase FAD-containing subunit